MFCTGCGREITEGDNYCPQCGKPKNPDRREFVQAPERRLVRIMSEKKIAGVCAGVARYLSVDPTLVRVVWLVLALLYGTGLIAYLIAWIAMPKDEPGVVNLTRA